MCEHRHKMLINNQEMLCQHGGWNMKAYPIGSGAIARWLWTSVAAVLGKGKKDRGTGEGVRDGKSSPTVFALRSIAAVRLPHRYNRIEPRAKKRRPKNLPLLTIPRQVARGLILQQRSLNRVL